MAAPKLARLTPVALPGTVANDTRDDLAEVSAEWVRIYRRAFRGRRYVVRVRYEADVLETTLVMVHLPRRVEAWRVERVLTTAVSLERFFMPVSC